MNRIAARTAFALSVLARILAAAAAAATGLVVSSASATTTMSTDACRGRSLSTPKASVLILARFAHLLPDDDRLDAYAARYPGLHLSTSTAHASKGLEADYVLILNMEQGVYGFPSGKPSDLVIERFLPQSACFEHADERRLFYVALTRARKHVWLLVPQDQKKMSVFVRELLQANKAAIRSVGKRSATGSACRGVSDWPGSVLNNAVKMACRLRPCWRLPAHENALADRQKRPIACVVDKIKRCIIGIGVGAEKKNRII